jgi:hypothetical protein
LTLELAEAVDVLSRTPGALRGLLGGASDAWLDTREGPDTFSPRDVVGHLIFGEETDWIPRLRIVLEHGPARPFEPFDRFGFRERYAARPIGELIDRFAALRAENLRTLDLLRLGPADLLRPGRHPELGAVTLGQLLATWTVHDLNHLAQIARVMARRYAEDVGPWRAYLRILA